MNVGLSRAISSLIVVGDSKKLITDVHWESLVKYAYRSATFYKVRGSIIQYVSNFESNYNNFKIKTDEEFVKAVYQNQ